LSTFLAKDKGCTVEYDDQGRVASYGLSRSVAVQALKLYSFSRTEEWKSPTKIHLYYNESSELSNSDATIPKDKFFGAEEISAEWQLKEVKNQSTIFVI
jgi:hypothetical protein